MTAVEEQATKTVTKSIKFSYNWNNKLNCNFFTTIRKVNPLHKVGEIYDIYVNETSFFKAKIIHMYSTHVSGLTECQCLHDTGYPKAETRAMLAKMHHIDISAIDEFEINLIYLQRLHWLKNLPVITELKKQS